MLREAVTASQKFTAAWLRSAHLCQQRELPRAGPGLSSHESPRKRLPNASWVSKRGHACCESRRIPYPYLRFLNFVPQHGTQFVRGIKE